MLLRRGSSFVKPGARRVKQKDLGIERIGILEYLRTTILEFLEYFGNLGISQMQLDISLPIPPMDHL